MVSGYSLVVALPVAVSSNGLRRGGLASGLDRLRNVRLRRVEVTVSEHAERCAYVFASGAVCGCVRDGHEMRSMVEIHAFVPPLVLEAFTGTFDRHWPTPSNPHSECESTIADLNERLARVEKLSASQHSYVGAQLVTLGRIADATGFRRDGTFSNTDGRLADHAESTIAELRRKIESRKILSDVVTRLGERLQEEAGRADKAEAQVAKLEITQDMLADAVGDDREVTALAVCIGLAKSLGIALPITLTALFDEALATYERLRTEIRILSEPSRDFADVVHFAFRYSLGRMTYAPSLVADFIRKNVDRIEKRQLAAMADEIGQADARGALGDGMDVDAWREFQRWINDRVYTPTPDRKRHMTNPTSTGETL